MIRPRTVGFDLCIYFAKRPGVVMFSDEIAERYDMQHSSLWRALRLCLELGYIERFKVPGERQFCYTAGPRLKEAA